HDHRRLVARLASRVEIFLEPREECRHRRHLGHRQNVGLLQPGGQCMGRPPSRCRWTWKTVCPAAAFVFITVRYPLAATAYFRAISAGLSESPPRSSASWVRSRLGTCSRGITSTCAGACGLMSRNAV